MKIKALISIKKKIKGFLEKVQSPAVSIIRKYIEGENFQRLLSLDFSMMIRRINESAMKELAETLADPKKFEEVFTYDLLIGDCKFCGGALDSQPKIELFRGVEFKSPDFQTALCESYITLFLLGRASNSANVIMITEADGVRNSYRLFSRVNTKTSSESFSLKAA